jgi:peptidoglycan hydrolase-like protein with peptidoglycan-binding domain
MNDLKQFSNERLWVSWYSNQNPPMFGGWQSAAFWQYNGGAPLQWLVDAKARIDLNYYMGDNSSLWDLTKEKQITPSASVNDKVEAVQYMLKKNNFYTGNIDGQFGPNTIAALNAWQIKNGLPKQDVITPNQWDVLFNLSPATKEVKAVAISKPGVVTVDKLNIRAGAGVSNPMVAAPLLQGQAVSILEENNGWYKVKTEVTGWVSKNYIKTN